MNISFLGSKFIYNDFIFSNELLNRTVNCTELLNHIGIRAPSVNTRRNTLFHIVPNKRNFIIHSHINRILRYNNIPVI